MGAHFPTQHLNLLVSIAAVRVVTLTPLWSFDRLPTFWWNLFTESNDCLLISYRKWFDRNIKQLMPAYFTSASRTKTNLHFLTSLHKSTKFIEPEAMRCSLRSASALKIHTQHFVSESSTIELLNSRMCIFGWYEWNFPNKHSNPFRATVHCSSFDDSPEKERRKTLVVHITDYIKISFTWTS